MVQSPLGSYNLLSIFVEKGWRLVAQEKGLLANEDFEHVQCDRKTIQPFRSATPGRM
jgi:hypothetical protein